jgi:hypothetical protein
VLGAPARPGGPVGRRAVGDPRKGRSGVSAACRELGVSRSFYYQLRGRFVRYGPDVLGASGHARGRGVPGLYAPPDPVFSDPLSPPNQGLQPNSAYGLQIPALGLLTTLYNIDLDFGNTYVPSTPIGLAGFPAVFLGTSGADVGTWDDTALTIPIHSSLKFQLPATSVGSTRPTPQPACWSRTWCRSRRP